MGESERFAAAIGDSMARARAHLVEIRKAMDALGAAGMWPAVPTEGWSPSKGLHMLFGSNPDGTYKGPDGKREVTIGTDPTAIAEARRLAENRRRWEACELAAWNLDKWISGRWLKLRGLAEDCQRWPVLDLGAIPWSPQAPRPVSETQIQELDALSRREKMGYQLYPEKHIHLVGLEKIGEGAYSCKYPDLLAAWLKKQGLVEVQAYGHAGHTELMLEGNIPPQPPESSLTPEEWEQHMRPRGYVHIYKTGSVRVGGASEKLERMLQELIRE